jgi:DNA-binding transcriptional ArsR family regulator
MVFRSASKYSQRGDRVGLSETLKAISDPVRRKILDMLKNGRMSAGEIANSFNLTGATVSYHLSQLKKADLVTETKLKNFIYYELNASVFEELLVWIYEFGGRHDEKA